MNDEQFEEEMCALEDCGHDDFVEALRDRDTAQRETLARVEAERDYLTGCLEETRHHWYRESDALRDVQAQLADVLYILDQHRTWTGMGWEQLPVPVHAAEKIRSKLAQAEQQEAQGAQAGGELIRKVSVALARSHEITPDEARRVRAALATQPDAGEPKPIGYISETVRQELLNGKHVPANICTATPSRRNPHPGPDANWSVPIFVAPPAAAHGDEAVQYRLLRVGEVIKATDELLMDDCITWHRMGDGPQIGIGWGWHAGLMPVRRIDAAMRAQGEGGEA